MRAFLIRVLVNAVALVAAAWIVPGIAISAPDGDGSLFGLVLTYLLLGVIFALVNAIAKPVVHILSLPFTILTLGLFVFVVNAAMLALTSWLAGFTPLHFTIDHFFWSAVLGAIVVSVVGWLAGPLVRAGSRS